METRIGISGWRYEPWRGTFYPEKLAQHRELEYASRQVNSIEINGSFYSLQEPTSYQRWFKETPDDFVFSIKGNRYITHITRLKEPASKLGNFFGSGVLHLKEKLGPILWQFPPSFGFDEERIGAFFEILPRTFGEAIKLMDHADRVRPDYPSGETKRRIRHAMEVRHHSFENPDFVDLLRKHNVALVFADTAGKWPYIEDVTSDFVYLRLHGEKEIYKSGYEEDSLKIWCDRLKHWQSGSQVKDAITISDKKPPKKKRDAYVYFDNDVKVRAPVDARKLFAMMKS
jgi:uncharacterized protein YecE (DUF72 family)